MLLETLAKPKKIKNKYGNMVYEDVSGKYLNILNGIRKTAYQPKYFIGTIYLIGNDVVFGYGSKDEETIASYLQRIIQLPYRVINLANDYNYVKQFEMLNEINFQKNDIIVSFINAAHNDNDYLVYPVFKELGNDFRIIDASPYFKQQNQDNNLFLTQNLYTSAGNELIAELVLSEIYKEIEL